MEEHGREAAHFHTYSEAVEWITGLMNFGIKPGLRRMEALAERLGNPERRLKFIHVAGTNGKGSVCAFLSSALIRAGYDVGTFTSPYIVKYTNRIQYNGRDIEEAELVELVNLVKPAWDEIAETELGPPTMFEVSTAIALLYFAKKTYPDLVVWETGLGGRLDSTNIVSPLVSVITNVGHDHMDVLGDTLAQIAGEKAGIIKPGVPVVSAVEQPEAVQVLEETASSRQSTLYLMNREFRYTPESTAADKQSMHFEGPFRRLAEVPVSLNGEHQFKNAAVVLMTLEVLRQYYALVLDDEEVYAGMKSALWPGRLEMVRQQPRLLLDGAHNPEGAETLSRALTRIYPYRRLHMLIGMLSTKNHRDFLKHILPIADTLIITEPDFRKKMDAGALAELAGRVRDEMELPRAPELMVEPDWRSALDKLLRQTGEDDLAVVSGTLYLISDVRSWILYQSDSEKGW